MITAPATETTPEYSGAENPFNHQNDTFRSPEDPVYQWHLENPELRPLLPENGFLSLKTHRYPFLDPDSLKELLLWMRKYNPQQLEAAVAEGNLHIKATAGSGKTTVLSSIAYTRIMRGIHPSRLAVCSFTTTAAEEIANRTLKLIHGYLRDITRVPADDIQQVQIQSGTFHSLALQELKHWKWARANQNSKVLDPYQVINLWREAIGFTYGAQRSAQLSEQNLQTFANLYDLLRNLNVQPPDAIYLIETLYRDAETESHFISQHLCREYPLGQPAGPIIQKYEEIKQKRGLLDYTDLLTQWLTLIHQYKDAYRNRWECILVDEYQDTSPLQQAILEEIHALGADIVTCGDSSQCINSFNGSDPGEQEKLTQRIGARSLTLTYNYRSSQKILQFANEILADCVTAKLPASNNQPPQLLQIQPRPNAPSGIAPDWRIFKRYTQYKEFNPLTENYFTDPGDLAAETVQIANDLYWELRNVMPNPTVAILYRTNNDGDLLEKQAIQQTSKLSAQNHKKIVPIERRDKKKSATINAAEQTLINAVKFWLNPTGNKGKHFLGQILKSSLFPQIGETKAAALITQLNIPITDPESAWIAFQKRIPNRNTGHMGYFLQAWERTIQQSQQEGHSQLTCTATSAQLRYFLAQSRIWDQSYEKKSGENGAAQKNDEPEEHSHQANFLAAMASMGPVPVNEFIQHRQAQNEAGKLQQTANFQGLILATIHLAKGNEYDGVVVHDVSSGKLPHHQALEDKRPGFVGTRGIRLLAALLSERIQLPSGTPYKPFEEKIQNLLSELRTQVARRVHNLKEYHTIQNLSQRPDLEKLIDPIEEERRLLYVAFTRAKHRLIITSRSGRIDHPFAGTALSEALEA
jgi:superfamily I DNA/RNA helicase